MDVHVFFLMAISLEKEEKLGLQSQTDLNPHLTPLLLISVATSDFPLGALFFPCTNNVSCDSFIHSLIHEAFLPTGSSHPMEENGSK